MKTLRLALVVVGACAALPAHATNGMRMIGFGPSQSAMGGVGVGATLDSAAIVTNPAGIADMDGRLDVDLGLFIPKPSYSAVGLNAETLPPNLFINQDNKEFDTTRGPSPIPFVGLVLPLTSDLKLGLSLSAVAGMGVTFDKNLYSSTTNTNYMQGRFAPALAYKVGSALSIGAGVNLMVAMMDWDVAGFFGQTPHDRATSFGIGAVVGIKVKPDPMISIGAAYETPSWFKDFSFDVPAHPATGFPGAQTVPAATDKLTFNQPMVATLGVAVTPFAGTDEGPLVIGVDVEWINWSWSNGLNKPAYTADSLNAATGATNGGQMPWNMNWSDQWVFKVGAQIAVTPGVKVRVGYNYGKDPLDSSRAFENISFPAVQEHHLTAGVGIVATDALTINLGGMFAPSSSVTSANGAPPFMQPGQPPPYGQGIVSATTKMSQWQFNAGIGLKL